MANDISLCLQNANFRSGSSGDMLQKSGMCSCVIFYRSAKPVPATNYVSLHSSFTAFLSAHIRRKIIIEKKANQVKTIRK